MRPGVVVLRRRRPIVVVSVYTQITFSGWKRRFEREDVGEEARAEAASLLAVELSEPGAESAAVPESGITVEMGDDVRLPLSPDFDAASLTRAVAVLRDARLTALEQRAA